MLTTYYLRGGIKGLKLEDLAKNPDNFPVEKKELSLTYTELPPILKFRVHREDGPAIIYPDGSFGWFYNGEPCSFNEWCEKAHVSEGDKMILQLTYL